MQLPDKVILLRAHHLLLRAIGLSAMPGPIRSLIGRDEGGGLKVKIHTSISMLVSVVMLPHYLFLKFKLKL